MRKAWLVIGIACIGASCKKPKRIVKDFGSDVGLGSGSGSGVGSGSGSAALKTLTVDELEKRYEECWGFWGTGKYDAFKTCYDTDATQDAPGTEQTRKSADAIAGMAREQRTAFPDEQAELQLVLVSGQTVVGIARIAGTNKGEMRAPSGMQTATNKKVGVMMAVLSAVDPQGRTTHESVYFDNATLLAQLGDTTKAPSLGSPTRAPMDLKVEKQVAIAKNDATEKANLATFAKLVDAFNRHDVAAAGELVTDDIVWSELAMDKDWDKTTLVDRLGKLWRAFTGLKFEAGKSQTWAAGEYVAAVETFTGWNDGDYPALNIKKSGRLLSLPALAVYRFAHGKIAAAWVFYQSMSLAQQVTEPLQVVVTPPTTNLPPILPRVEGTGSGSGAKVLKP